MFFETHFNTAKRNLWGLITLQIAVWFFWIWNSSLFTFGEKQSREKISLLLKIRNYQLSSRWKPSKKLVPKLVWGDWRKWRILSGKTKYIVRCTWGLELETNDDGTIVRLWSSGNPIWPHVTSQWLKMNSAEISKRGLEVSRMLILSYTL